MFNSVLNSVLFLFLMASCGIQNNNEQVFQNEFSGNVGYVHHNCLAIKNGNLKKGATVDIIVSKEDPWILKAQILAKIENHNCAILMNGRIDQNLRENYFFYKIDQKSENILSPSIAFINKNVRVKKSKNKLLVNINSDDKFQSYITCNTSEGIIFSIWSDEPFTSERIWKEYYYLGYDLKPTCPNKI